MRFLARAALVFIAMATGAGAAEETELRSLTTANDSRGWEAVGRLDIGTDGFCTGALIAPDIVLTAAHCLFDPYTLERVDDRGIEFLAGWRNGRATAYRKVRRTVIHPDYVYNGPRGADHVADDIAILQLSQPIRKGSVTPFKTDKRPRKGDQVGVVSYARDRASRPSLQEVCHVLGRPFGSLIMSCSVDFGSSGAPVFSFDSGEPKIVSVISAKAEISGRSVSLGTRLAQSLPTLMEELEKDPAETGTVAETPKVRAFEPRGNAKTSGAKFLRP